MKLFRAIYLLFFLIVIACCKENPVEPSDSINSNTDFRISEQNTYLNNRLVQRLVYEYQDDKLTMLKTFNANINDELIEEGRNEFTYEGDNIYLNTLNNQTGVWVETSGFTEYVIQNDDIVEQNYYQQMVLSGQGIYYYQGQNEIPTYYEAYAIRNGALKLIEKGEFKENSEVIYSRLDENEMFNEYSKSSYSYLNGQLNEIILYNKELDTDDIWIQNEKINFNFSGKELLSKDFYQWNVALNNWTNSYSDSFKYDSNGLLIEQFSSYFLENRDIKIVYNYDVGIGNLSIFHNSGWKPLDETPDPQ